MRFLSRFKIIARIQKLQKSKKKVVQKTLLKIVLVWLAAFCVLGYVCWSNRAANENNTYTVQVSGETVSLHKKVHDAPVIKFQQESCIYRAIWRNYSPHNVSFVVEDMMNEEQLTLTVLQGTDGRVVAITSDIQEYLGVEEYNDWHWMNMFAGVFATALLATILTLLYGIQLRTYIH